MDFSSPLAAMHPPPPPTWGSRRDLPASRLSFNALPMAPSNFDFKDMSMHARCSSDYFTSRPHRGSSPTASLAADLSSNFHIDQSPQVPTPRRSLFVRHVFRPGTHTGLLATPPVDHELATTPPVPESSPGIEAMDISPLPHKVPCFVAKIILASPTPDDTPAPMADILAALEQPAGSPMDFSSPSDQMQMVLPERKKPILQRPPLLRPKTYSSNAAPPSKEVLLPPFQFGSGAPKLTCASMPNLSDCAVDSPLDIKPPTPTLLSAQPGLAAPLVVPRRPSLSLVAKGMGSPGGGVVKRPSLAPQRPRKQVRRSLSMFQHPEDVLRPAQDYERPIPPMQPAPDMDMDYKHKLPHTLGNDPDSLPRIQQDTLINVMNGQYDAHYDKVLVVDCRFEYEYKGGHIDGAVNYNDKESLARELFEGDISPRTLLVLHCEYSVHRAPMTAKFIRNRDRAVNDFQYPRLTFPEMYILDGGYSRFFKLHREKCFPQNYVEMEHKDHALACEKGMGRLKKQRAKLGRAQTFAFGQSSCQMEDSPTSGCGPRIAVRSFSAMDTCDISPIIGRHFNIDVSPMARTSTRRLATA